MKLAIPNQAVDGETRVALVPAVVKRLIAASNGKLKVVVESGAGRDAHAYDEAFEDAGATVVTDGIWADSDLVLTLQPPTIEQAEALRSGSVLIGMLNPVANAPLIQTLVDRKVTSLSMEFMPRISRAQSMDVLSSQANISGYKATVLAADQCPKMFPMMITAAGTIAPCRVFVVGVGVAGLQAIATAKRLGAVVEAYDVRPAVKEQVQSLGARFVELEMESADAETAGGYAKEQTDEQRRKQSALMSKHVISADVVITTAAIFGKPPPMLIPADTVAQMSSGSVIVDLAADPAHDRGNCESTKPGQIVTTDQGVTLIGTLNLPTLVPVHASQVYANNMHALLKELLVDGELKLDLDDEIQAGATITHEGQVVNEVVRERMG